MIDSQRNELIAAACQVRRQAYADYSGFQVGAALRTSSGRVVVGTNVENASYGLTNCAERVAIGNAVTAGERQFEALTVATEGGAPPCGACRQVLSEFCDDLLINEFDYDPDGTAARLFQENYLNVSQHGQAPIRYAERFIATVNTGVATGYVRSSSSSTAT
jgi:cytidine deaminase